MKMYVNNVLQTSTNANTIPIAGNSYPTYIGGNHSYGIRYVQAKLSNLKIWTTSKTAGEIAAEENVICDGTEIGLVECFPFLNETGATTTGVKGVPRTIETNNAGGLTYINSTIREVII